MEYEGGGKGFSWKSLAAWSRAKPGKSKAIVILTSSANYLACEQGAAAIYLLLRRSYESES